MTIHYPESVEAPPADNTWLEMETVNGGSTEPLEALA